MSPHRLFISQLTTFRACYVNKDYRIESSYRQLTRVLLRLYILGFRLVGVTVKKREDRCKLKKLVKFYQKLLTRFHCVWPAMMPITGSAKCQLIAGRGVHKCSAKSKNFVSATWRWLYRDSKVLVCKASNNTEVIEIDFAIKESLYMHWNLGTVEK